MRGARDDPRECDMGCYLNRYQDVQDAYAAASSERSHMAVAFQHWLDHGMAGDPQG